MQFYILKIAYKWFQVYKQNIIAKIIVFKWWILLAHFPRVIWCVASSEAKGIKTVCLVERALEWRSKNSGSTTSSATLFLSFWWSWVNISSLWLFLLCEITDFEKMIYYILSCSRHLCLLSVSRLEFTKVFKSCHMLFNMWEKQELRGNCLIYWEKMAGSLSLCWFDSIVDPREAMFL